MIPRAHAPYLADLDPADAERMMAVAQRLAQALRDSTIPTEGINLFLADGEVAFQEVLHAHLHVLPRTAGDGFGLTGGFTTPPREILDAQAATVRAALS